jgi:hypothetical protein
LDQSTTQNFEKNAIFKKTKRYAYFIDENGQLNQLDKTKANKKD